MSALDPHSPETVGKESLFVALSGGLGNQLFQWAAGFNFSKNLGLDLVLCNVEVGDRGFPLSRFGFEGANEELPSEVKRLILRRPKKERWEEKVLWNTKWRALARRLISENGISFDSKLENRIGPGTVIRGGFQSELYFGNRRSEIRAQLLSNLRLTSDAEDFLKRQSGKRWAAIHVRRGDYLKFPHVFSIPGQQYFANARDWLVQADSSISEFVVFSDDIDEARKAVPWADAYVGAEISDPVDILGVLASSKNFIASNSTLSWWSSFLHGPQQSVTFPTPWFSDISIQESNLLPSWGHLNSHVRVVR